jgi:cytidylate kinase
MIITIDGPAGTGKTTVARRVAEKLKFKYFDTGAMYRALTFQIMEHKVDLQNAQMLETFLGSFHFEIQDTPNGKRYFADTTDVTDVIRNVSITQKVSEVAAHPEVRKKLVTIQREFGKGKNAVFEGRDMGTVVFPEAELKVFLTARPAVRAERRYLEFKEKKMPTTQDEVLQELLARDHFDSTREVSPLKQAEDAHIIDTSDLTIDQVINQIVELLPKIK